MMTKVRELVWSVLEKHETETEFDRERRLQRSIDILGAGRDTPLPHAH